MTRKTVSPATIVPTTAYSWAANVLVEMDARYVPMMLQDTEARKLRFAWASDEEWAIGYDAVCRLQEALLMDIGDRVISEIRALRDGTTTPPALRDPKLDPYTLDLTTLADIDTSVGIVSTEVINANTAIVGELQAIKALLEAQGGEELTEILGKLDILIALL